MEEFGKELVAFFLDRNPQAFCRASLALRKILAALALPAENLIPRHSSNRAASARPPRLQLKDMAQCAFEPGLENLVILKTTGSAFTGFIKDSLTTLPESTDRLFGTALRARWTTLRQRQLSPPCVRRLREILLNVFAKHTSKSVQHTLYAMGEGVLANVPEIEDIELTMPNKHYLLADLSRFGQDNPNEIFVPIDEPHGTIEARLRRQG